MAEKEHLPPPPKKLALQKSRSVSFRFEGVDPPTSRDREVTGSSFRSSEVSWASYPSFSSVESENSESPIGIDTYRVCNHEEIRQRMENYLKKTCGRLMITPAVARPLLDYFKWELNDLCNSWYEDKTTLLENCGVFQHHEHCIVEKKINSENTCSSSTNVNDSKSGMCTICLENTKLEMMPCNHFFCASCWTGYIESNIAEGPSCVMSTCPQDKCKELVTELEVELFASSHLEKFKEYQFRASVFASRDFHWCPGPGCSFIFVKSGTVYGAQCNSCQTTSCLRCGQGVDHRPAKCENMEEWNEKSSSGSANERYILMNAKKCPRCKSPSERVSGCNHITCHFCNHEYCWICLADWSTHGDSTGGFYSCNRYVPDVEQDSIKAEGIVSLQRFNHHYDRFAAHLSSEKSALEMNAMLGDVENATHHQGKLVDLQEWTRFLAEGRRVLAYSYVLSFFNPVHSRKEYFEDQQQMFEGWMDRLTEWTRFAITSLQRESMDKSNLERLSTSTLLQIKKLCKEIKEDPYSG